MKTHIKSPTYILLIGNWKIIISKIKNLEIVGLDVRPDAHEAAQTRDPRLTHKLPKRGREIYKVDQIG